MIIETYRIWKQEEYSYAHAFGFIPHLHSYIHDEDDTDRPCMLVVPGGGYCFVSPSEGEPVALRFYEKGYQVFVLTYTVNLAHQIPLKMQPLHDLSRAVRYLRKYAGRFHLIEDQVSVCGFSAGGHLCASLCVHWEDIEEQAEEYAGISNRPDAAILSYPVITAGEMAHRDSFTCLLGEDASEQELEYMSLETQVTEKTPPVFLWTTVTDDAVPAENSELFADACRKNGVVYALHMFSYGGHGLSAADQQWANMENENPYTMEQHERVLEKVHAGELSISKEILAGFEPSQEDEERQPGRMPNTEVAVWMEMADAFLKDLYLRE